ncbi:MAG: hypothetical protein KGL53_05245, partial [Elusimicrobia bacterium]|nr:hypothetical protein [Elusimicrobiota bacterium]
MSRRNPRAALAGLLGSVLTLASPLAAADLGSIDFDGLTGAGVPSVDKGADSGTVPQLQGVPSPLVMYTSDDVVSVYSELAEPIPNPKPEDSVVIDGKTLWRGTQIDKGEAIEVTEERPDGWWHVNIP